MKTSPVLIDGAWREARAVDVFRAFDPARGVPLPEEYPVSSFADAEEALRAGRRAAPGLAAADPETIAAFLDRMAGEIERRAGDLVETAHRETALPEEPRLRSNELPRTANQLRQAADAVRDRSWKRASIDTAPNIRSIHEPLGGPVVVFGPNNFPFAFNAAAGGDFAAAFAAGNPVIAKAHPGHPATTRIFAEIALEGLEKTGLPPASLQMVYHLAPADGLRLVAHPLTAAVAFTGSRQAGLRLKESADRAGKPVYLEMSSVNPVFFLPGAIEERGESLAAELFASCGLGAGQFCTKPGLIVYIDNESGKSFLEALRARFQSPPSGFLLGPGVLESVQNAVTDMVRGGAEICTGGRRAEGPGFRFENTLLRVSGETFLAAPSRLQHEAFGTVTLAVAAADEEQMLRAAGALEGSLSACIYADTSGGDDLLYDRLTPILRPRTGRLLNDKMPTGLAVVPSMVHGGPWPATGHPGFTSVGIPASLLRFTAIRCYDGVRPHRLPPELGDRNPTGRMWRLVNGSWTQKDV